MYTLSISISSVSVLVRFFIVIVVIAEAALPFVNANPAAFQMNRFGWKVVSSRAAVHHALSRANYRPVISSFIQRWMSETSSTEKTEDEIKAAREARKYV